MVMGNRHNVNWLESNEVLFAEKAALANGSAVTKFWPQRMGRNASAGAPSPAAEALADVRSRLEVRGAGESAVRRLIAALWQDSAVTPFWTTKIPRSTVHWGGSPHFLQRGASNGGGIQPAPSSPPRGH
jgi:hypothetical protein